MEFQYRIIENRRLKLFFGKTKSIIFYKGQKNGYLPTKDSKILKYQWIDITPESLSKKKIEKLIKIYDYNLNSPYFKEYYNIPQPETKTQTFVKNLKLKLKDFKVKLSQIKKIVKS